MSLIRTFRYGRYVSSVAFSNRGEWIAFGGIAGPLNISKWSQQNVPPTELSDGANSPVQVAFTRDDVHVVAGMTDISVSIFNIKKRKIVRRMEGHSQVVTDLALSTKVPNLVVTAAYDYHVCIWDVQKGRLVKSIDTDKLLGAVSCSNRDGTAIVAASRKIIFISVDKGVVLRELNEKAVVRIVGFSPDGLTYTVVYMGGRTCIRDSYTHKELKVVELHTNRVTSIAYSPDGNYLVCGLADYTIAIWSVKRQRVVHTLKCHTDQINRIVFHPKRLILASASNDGTVAINSIEGIKA